jgi:hypothetical protein
MIVVSKTATFSRPAFAFTSVTPVPVPFGIKVKWNVEGDEDISMYEIEAFQNGRYTHLATMLKSSLNTFADKTATYTRLRIKALHKDRRTAPAYSKDIVLTRTLEERAVGLKLYPNPAPFAGKTVLQLDEAIGNAEVRIINMQTNQQKRIVIAGFKGDTALPLQGLPLGMYSVEVTPRNVAQKPFSKILVVQQ